MKKFLWCLIFSICSIFCGCSSNEHDTPEIPSKNENETTDYDNLFASNMTILEAAIDNATITDVTSAKAFCAKLKGYESAREPKAGFISLYFKGGHEYFIDFSGECISEEGEEASDSFDASAYIDDINEALGWETPSAPEAARKEENRARSGSSDDELLSKHNVLYWAPFHGDFPNIAMGLSDLRKQLTNKGIKIEVTHAYPGAKGISTVMQTLQYLQKMDEYDVVYIATHGDPEGRLIIPDDGSLPPMMVPQGKIWSKSKKKVYQNLCSYKRLVLAKPTPKTEQDYCMDSSLQCFQGRCGFS